MQTNPAILSLLSRSDPKVMAMDSQIRTVSRIYQTSHNTNRKLLHARQVLMLSSKIPKFGKIQMIIDSDITNISLQS